MSIKGIDTQMMITRLADNVRETSAMQKKPEVTQEFLAVQGQINDAQDQGRVLRTSESEMEQIRTDVDEESGGGGGGESAADHKAREEDEFAPGMLVPPGNNIIDIKI